MMNWLLRNVLAKIVAIPVRRRLEAFRDATHFPREVQADLLRRILRDQKDTAFGRDHHFADIRDAAGFQRNLPVAGYDYFEPYITKVTKGDTNALLSDPKVYMFAMTSGTTAARKYIPVTSQYLQDYRRGWNLWGLKVFRDHPEVKIRPILQMSGDWQEFNVDSGVPCGSVTGLTAQMQFRMIRWLYCAPACVGLVKDPLAKYYLALRLSIPRKVGMIIAANPSTLVNMARAGDSQKEALIKDIRDGTLSERYDIPSKVRDALRGRLKKKHPDRAKELDAIVSRTGALYPKDYWPKDCLIGNWMGGTVGQYLRHFPIYFGETPVRDVGLIASEGRMTIPVSDGTPSGVLDVTSHFFEFIPEDEGDSKNPTVLQAHEVEVGKTYYILLTTSYGLYRYHIYDVVRVTGHFNNTPLIEFLSKGKHFANITGEKISEYHVVGAMTQALRDLDMNLTAYSMAPIWDDRQPYYGLFVERGDLKDKDHGMQLLRAVESKLASVNVEYAAKRESQRLGPVRLSVLPTATWHDWDRKRLAGTGGTLEQYKHPCLISDPKFRESLTVQEEWALE